MHRHKVFYTQERGWGWCVAPDDCDGIAHGNIVDHDYCSCGAERLTEINQRHSVSSGWFYPDGREEDE